MTTTLDYALDYIRAGWSVIPLLPQSKQPALKIAPFLSGEYRFDADEARDYWRQHPDHGIAIVTGKPSGIVVIDVDPRNGGDAGEVMDSVDETFAVSTGGGGVHLFCRYPDGASSIACGKTALPGVDRKGDGGYVVAPPSIHPSGQPYVVLADKSTLARLPEWACRAPGSNMSPAGEPTQPWVAATLAAPVLCRPGAQEETLSRLCWWAARNLDRDIADAVLGRWLAALPLGDPTDPWTEDHLAERLDRAYEKRTTVERGDAGPLVDDTLPDPKTLWETPDTMAFPEQEWVVVDFAAPGAYTELIGKVKKGKSTLAYQLIAAVLDGTPFLDRETVQSPVVLLTEQSGTSLKKTLDRAGLLGRSDLYILRKQRLKYLKTWNQAIHFATQKCIEVDAKLLVVDTLSRLAGIGGDAENSSGSVNILDPFDDAKEHGIACLFIRHSRKGQGDDDDIADAARGSSAISGEMDIRLRLKVVSDDCRMVEWESRISDDPDDIYLDYEEGTYVLGDKPPGKMEQRKAEDTKAFAAAVEKVGTTYSALEAELGWGRGKIRRYLKQHETYSKHGPHARPVLEE